MNEFYEYWPFLSIFLNSLSKIVSKIDKGEPVDMLLILPIRQKLKYFKNKWDKIFHTWIDNWQTYIQKTELIEWN